MWQRFSNLLELDLWVFINLFLNECKIFDLWKRRNKFLIDRDRYSEYLNRGRSVNKLALQVWSDLRPSLPSSQHLYLQALNAVNLISQYQEENGTKVTFVWRFFCEFRWQTGHCMMTLGMFVSIYFLFKCSK